MERERSQSDVTREEERTTAEEEEKRVKGGGDLPGVKNSMSSLFWVERRKRPVFIHKMRPLRFWKIPLCLHPESFL